MVAQPVQHVLEIVCRRRIYIEGFVGVPWSLLMEAHTQAVDDKLEKRKDLAGARDEKDRQNVHTY